MAKPDPGGMQSVARQAQSRPRLGLEAALGEAVEIPFVRPVNLVADDRKARLSEVASDLVLPPRLRQSAQQRKPSVPALKSTNHAKRSARGFPRLRIHPDRDADEKPALGKWRVDLELVSNRPPLANGEVLLVHLSVGEGGHQAAGGFRMAGAYDDSRSLAIEPMNGR